MCPARLPMAPAGDRRTDRVRRRGTGVRGDPHHEIQITVGGALAAAAALASQADALPIGHAGRDPDVKCAPAVGTFQGDRPAAALESLLHGQLEFGFLVGARDRAPAPAGPASEDPAEEVLYIDAAQVAAQACAEPAGAPRASGLAGPRGSRAGAAALERLRIHVLGHLPEVRAEGVVTAPGLRIGQHVVRLGDFLEPVLGSGILVDVGMVLAGQLAVGLLDLVLGRGPRHAQNLVEVTAISPRSARHQSPLATTTCAGRSWRSGSP